MVVQEGQQVFHQNELGKAQNYLKNFLQSQTLLLNTPLVCHVHGMSVMSRGKVMYCMGWGVLECVMYGEGVLYSCASVIVPLSVCVQ